MANARQETPVPNTPTEPICNNPAWYQLFATTEEKIAYVMQKCKEENDRRYRELIRDIDDAEDTSLPF